MSRVVDRDLLLASLTKLVKLDIKMFLLSIIGGTVTDSKSISGSAFFSGPRVRVKATITTAMVLLFDNLLTKLVPT